MAEIDKSGTSERARTLAESPASTSSSTGPTPGVLDWPAAFRAGVEVVGGKGRHLSRLARYGFQVPRGGVVPAGVYESLCRHRPVAEAIGRRLRVAGRLARADDVFHLGLSEVEAFLDGSWDGVGAARLVEDRSARFAAQQALDLPGVIDGHDERSAPTPSPLPATLPDAAPGAEWQGVAAAPGVATGPACVLRSPHDGAGMARGDVLVAPSTDPGWTPLFLRASAVVMETGGYLSHGAVVARELGLPAVVNVPDAMRRIAAGDQLRVDGDRGRVSRLGGAGLVE